MRLNQTLLRAGVPFNYHLEEQVGPFYKKPGGQETGDLSPAPSSATGLGGECGQPFSPLQRDLVISVSSLAQEILVLHVFVQHPSPGSDNV